MVYRALERLHLARDGKTVVKPGDPKSASLLVPKGGELSDEEARKYGLIPGGPSNTIDVALEPPQQPGVNTPPPTHGFPQNLQFGKPAALGNENKEQSSLDQSDILEPPAELGAIQSPLSEETASENQEQIIEGNTELPANFPHRMILINQNFGTQEKVLSATRDQLLALDMIGTERADEIIEARQKLLRQ